MPRLHLPPAAAPQLHAHTPPLPPHPPARLPAGVYASQSLDAAACALQDVLTVALYRLAATFGDGLPKVLAEAKAKPAFGSPAEATALLQQFLKGQA